MNSEVKIPTLLGMGVLLVGVVASLLLLRHNQNLQIQATRSKMPKNITVANLSANSATLYWQTDEPSPGLVKASPSSFLGQTFLDERDLKSAQPYNWHFVTLNNLSPDTTYYYKVISGPITFPQKEPLTFKTASSLSPSDHQAVIGTVLDSSLQPAKEALVTLEIPGAQALAAITKYSGNFILPLSEIRTGNLNDNFDMNSIKSARLTVEDSLSRSQVNIPLPLTEAVLPPIIMGKDLDLTVPNSFFPKPTKAVETSYDFNGDGVINSLDISLLRNNLDRRAADKKFDINGDGVVNIKDLDLTLKSFGRVLSR